MVRKKSALERIFGIFNVLFMILVVFITLYPMYYVLVCSLSDSANLIGSRGLILFPQGFELAAYKAVFKNPNIMTGYRTTIIVLVVGTTMSVLTTAIGAFLTTRKNMLLSKPLMYGMVFTMYFSGGMMPTYLVVKNILKLDDSILALILPEMISVYNLIIMKSNFESLPASLEEAARVDGANDIRLLFQIVLPLSKAVIAVMVLYYGVAYWNAWFGAMMYIRTRAKYPLQIILREILLSNSVGTMGGEMSSSAGDQYMIGESIKYATIMVATLPILFLYPFIQKYFVRGVMIGAVKG